MSNGNIKEQKYGLFSFTIMKITGVEILELKISFSEWFSICYSRHFAQFLKVMIIICVQK